MSRRGWDIHVLGDKLQ